MVQLTNVQYACRAVLQGLRGLLSTKGARQHRRKGEPKGADFRGNVLYITQPAVQAID